MKERIQMDNGAADMEVEDMPYDFFYTDGNGESYPLCDGEEITPYCVHNLIRVEGTRRHIKNSDGSCHVIIGPCLRCTKCGYVEVLKEIDSDTYYRLCPH